MEFAADVPAGVVVAAYLVPQCLAYATLAGLPALSGLWAAAPALAAYALFGSSPYVSTGPESASALLAGGAAAAIAASSPEVTAADAAAALAIVVGGLALGGRALRLGFLADLLSRPVIVGFLAGVGISMTLSQLPSLTGIDVDARSPLERATAVAGRLDETRLAPVLLALAALVALAGTSRARRIPGPLIVVVAASVAAATFGLEQRGVELIGPVPSGLPRPRVPSVPAKAWLDLVTASLGVLVVAFSDDVATARAFRAPNSPRIDANRELTALGAANLAAGVCAGFPVSSSETRTAIARAAGGRSRLTSLTAAAIVIIVLAAGSGPLAKLPVAALAALVVHAALRLVEPAEMRRLWRFRRSEAAIMALTMIAVVVFGVLEGIGAAVTLSVADLVRRIARGHDAVLGSVPGLAGLHDVDDYPAASTEPGLVVYRYDAPLCFANADDFLRRALAAVDSETAPVEWIVLNMEANVETDLTAVDMLAGLQAELAGQGITLALARVKRDLATYLERAGLVETIGPELVFPTLPSAMEAFRRRDGGLRRA